MRPLPEAAREAASVGHAVLITTATGRFLLPADLIAAQWEERFAHNPTAVITTTGAFGDFFTPARQLPTVTEQIRATLREDGCTVHLGDGSILDSPARRPHQSDTGESPHTGHHW